LGNATISPNINHLCAALHTWPGYPCLPNTQPSCGDPSHNAWVPHRPPALQSA